ncbi:MAG: citrate/2-methylcitrate synthase [Balneolaceae bacterium]
MADNNVPEISLDNYPHINRGLEGIVAFTTTKSFIDGQNGELIYAGYNIRTLAEKATFEEVCYLLWHDHLPSAKELEALEKSLLQERFLPPTILEFLGGADPSAEPMSVLRSAVSMLADYAPEPTANEERDLYNCAIALTAKIPAIIASYDRIRNGNEPVEPLEDGSTARNFLYMLNGEIPGAQAEKTMDRCLILHAEHGMNASTFTCRTICSTQSDIFSAVTGAIGALKGPLHGGANSAVMRMFLDIRKKGEDPADYVLQKLENREKVMGFGHRVYKTMDPRATLLREMARSLAEETGQVELYEWSESILNTMKKEKGIDPNVDFYSATVYYSLGIQPDLYTCIFTMSRISGWSAHFIEQAKNNRLIRPRALYTAEKHLEWPVSETNS